MTGKVLRVGILGAGGVSEKIYLPILLQASNHNCYQVTSIYHANEATAHAYQKTYDIPRATTIAEDIIHDPGIDLIIITLPTEYHEQHIISSLDAGKHVLVDAPITLSLQSTRRILEAENGAPNNARVFVSSPRRYAPCFEETFKREVAHLGRIYYARCRNISGPTRPRQLKSNGTTHSANDDSDDSDTSQLCQQLMREVFTEQDLNKERIALCRFLATTGCHDLSAMRETLGYPDGVSCVSVNDPFYSAIFHYRNEDGNGDDQPFRLMYEAGTDAVPRCDAQMTVYGASKTVSIHFDPPYDRGQVRVVVEEMDEDGRLKTTMSVSSYEDAYHKEFRALYSFLVDGQQAKTTASDAKMELELFRMMFEQYDRQCGTIRTPLG